MENSKNNIARKFANACCSILPGFSPSHVDADNITIHSRGDGKTQIDVPVRIPVEDIVINVKGPEKPALKECHDSEL